MSKAHVWLSWLRDSDRGKIPRELKPLYKEIFFRSWEMLGKSPRIFDSEDFNDKIKWLMIFDQHEDVIRCSDKLAVRDYVSAAIGDRYLNTVFKIWDSPDEITFEGLPERFVIKTNHDSGSVWIVPRRDDVDEGWIKAKIRSRMRRRYGLGKGEWCYQYIAPRAFAEEYLPSGARGIPDYKFHCANGKVAFVHYICDRETGRAKEKILRPDGRSTELRLCHEFDGAKIFERPAQWDEMIGLAEELSRPFKYVRVDLYCHDRGIRFGEMTFYPKNGNYRCDGQRTLGSWLEIDRSQTRSLRHPNLGRELG